MSERTGYFRVFEVQAKAGMAPAPKKKLASTSVAVVEGQAGNLGYFFGEVPLADANRLVFISIWKDLESIRSFFGAAWQQALLPDGYEELIEDCSIRHIEFDGKWVPD